MDDLRRCRHEPSQGIAGTQHMVGHKLPSQPEEGVLMYQISYVLDTNRWLNCRVRVVYYITDKHNNFYRGAKQWD